MKTEKEIKRQIYVMQKALDNNKVEIDTPEEIEQQIVTLKWVLEDLD